MERLLWVGLGGMAGSMARYLLNLLVERTCEPLRYPLGILTVNVIGCLAAGFVAGRVHLGLGPEAGLRLFVMVGLLGGFTTFSSFGLDTFELLRAQRVGAAVLNVGLNVFLALGAVWAGYATAQRLAGS